MTLSPRHIGQGSSSRLSRRITQITQHPSSRMTTETHIHTEKALSIKPPTPHLAKVYLTATYF